MPRPSAGVRSPPATRVDPIGLGPSSRGEFPVAVVLFKGPVLVVDQVRDPKLPRQGATGLLRFLLGPEPLARPALSVDLIDPLAARMDCVNRYHDSLRSLRVPSLGQGAENQTTARTASAIARASISAIPITGVTRLEGAKVRTYPARDTAWAMSQENVELVRRSFELWLRGDAEGWIDTLDPEIGWDISTHPLPDVPNHGRGRGALVTDMLAVYLSGWNDYTAELKELIDAGEQVVAVIHETATMGETGVTLDRDLVQLWTVRDGRGTFLRVFQTKAEALKAAGLAE
jgi:ketosteroid isomerase-like protein